MAKAQATAGLSAQEKQYRLMTQSSVRPLIIRLAIPTIITMMVTSLYNMADTYFVSQLGKSASGAVGVVFSLMAIIQALGFTLGMGSGSVVSRALGVRDYDKASRFASAAIMAAVVLGLALTVAGYIFINPLMSMLGATPTVLPYARDYASYILFGAPIMASSFVLNNLLRAEGKAQLSMVGITTGGVLNIALDPLFIFVFDMGVAGAAIATLISQTVSCVILLIMLLTKSTIRVSVRHAVSGIGTLWETVRTGAPSFCRQGLASISTILLNNQAGEYGGDEALSGMSIVLKIYMLIFCVGLGIGQGYQPVAGYNYGAKLWGRVRTAFTFTFVVGTACLSALGIVALIFAPDIIPLFIDDPKVIDIGARALRFQAIALPFLCTNVVCNMTFQATGSKLRAVLLSCCRQGFFFIPCVMILPPMLGLLGVELVQAVSDFCTFLVSIPFAVGFLRSISRLEQEEEAEIMPPAEKAGGVT